ncbi:MULTISPECIES: alkene reductase [unclassified Corynebacterium]|uniref:alkene reductase n=1 Tax=unclassified Corynebacterium TaxID=2624378 RepID=UPI001EF3DA2B|nr:MULTISPECIES: alkene reductase [unclassified Corynebacterium]MCG7259510.1 alkene reductase [Corynebacterium sp. ACRQK]MCG7263927.1 alkene reductase [Corynebacterium sp. ACRQL]
MTTLFTPLELGRFTLNNRVTMAALTRQRAGHSAVPNELHTKYYSQRASAGLVVTEGTFPAWTNRAFPGQAGIANEEQAAGWKGVANAVHDAGGVLFMQIMHGGRTSHPDLIDGAQAEAPSALGWDGQVRGFAGKMDAPVPRALEVDELPRIVEEFRRAARRAIDAGVDGVEVHNANGYLLHEFLAPSANQREDEFGGSPENRWRLPEMVIRAIVEEIGADRVGVRFSPGHNVQGVIEDDEEDMLATYGGLLDALAPVNLAYVSFLHAQPEGELIATLANKARANGVTKVLMNDGFGTVTTKEDAQRELALDYVDAVVVGRQLIANPDLVRRWQEGLALNEPDQDTFYMGGERGYTDYPTAAD